MPLPSFHFPDNNDSLMPKLRLIGINFYFALSATAVSHAEETRYVLMN